MIREPNAIFYNLYIQSLNTLTSMEGFLVFRVFVNLFLTRVLENRHHLASSSNIKFSEVVVVTNLPRVHPNIRMCTMCSTIQRYTHTMPERHKILLVHVLFATHTRSRYSEAHLGGFTWNDVFEI